MFDTEGVSYIAMVNSTATLSDIKSISSGISGGDLTVDSLEYEWEDSEYKWDQARDLKAKEPFFASGFFYDDNSDVRGTLMAALSKQKELLEDHDNDKGTVRKAHMFGIDNMMPLMSAMNYDTLMNIYVELFKDKSEDGVMKSNIYTELLGSTGTTAAAMVVRDLVMDRKFDNCRDTARVMVSVPYHIRRPNRQLVEEFAKLETADLKCDFAERAWPVVMGHLVKMTCSRANVHKQGDRKQEKACFASLGAEWVKKLFQKYKSAGNRQEEISALAGIHNIGFGGTSDTLEPIIDGSMPVSSEIRAIALWSAMPENLVKNKLMNVYFPIFAEDKNDHETRIHALNIMLTEPLTTRKMARIVTVLRNDKDYELINYVFTKLEAVAGSIDPCGEKSAEVAGFFLKYLKQFSLYRPDYGFGVSKTYLRQFTKDKYGYSGEYSFSTIGSHESTTPIMVSMKMAATFQKSYHVHQVNVILRVEGLAKGLIRKFKSMDQQTWKTNDLESIFREMNIQQRPSQPVKVAYIIMLKNTIAFTGSFDMNSPSKMTNFMDSLKTVVGRPINHQRIFAGARFTLEQPTDIGLPAAYGISLHSMLSLKATPKYKSARGMIQVGLDYDAHLFAQGKNTMFVRFPMRKQLYGIAQDRVYHIHVPRSISLGVNPAKKMIKLQVSRPEREHPAMFMMHAQTMVLSKNSNPAESPKVVVLSKGPDAARLRTVVDNDNAKWGFASKIQYFDCEMEIARGNTLSKALAAFMPYNKNPKTPWTSIVMGVRQVTTFLVLYPRAEKCGIYASWSQSTENPVNRLELSITGNKQDNGEKLFLRGRKLQVEAVFKAIGDRTRAYRARIVSSISPGSINQRLKVDLERSKEDSLGIKPYKICLTYLAEYPKFESEMYNADLTSNYQMKGKAKLEYGEAASCAKASGIISLNFKYSTTDEAKETLKKKWYYKDCMTAKNSPVWAQRNGLPVTFSCGRTIHDAYTARNYNYQLKFEKVCSL